MIWFQASRLLGGIREADAAICGDACNSHTDCAGLCPVCSQGYCVDCATMGDQTNCEDVGTGASVHCGWVGGACTQFPETPKPNLVIPLMIVVVGSVLIFLKQRRRKSSL